MHNDLVIPKNGRFPRGKSGNPAGRPPGSRNKATLAAEQLLEGEAEQLTRTAIAMAKKGDIQALRLCLERLMPVRKERCLTLDLKPVQNSNELPLSFADVITAVGEGRITPGEGSALALIMTSHAQSIETHDLVARLQALESDRDEMRRLRRQAEQELESACHES